MQTHSNLTQYGANQLNRTLSRCHWVTIIVWSLEVVHISEVENVLVLYYGKVSWEHVVHLLHVYRGRTPLRGSVIGSSTVCALYTHHPSLPHIHNVHMQLTITIEVPQTQIHMETCTMHIVWHTQSYSSHQPLHLNQSCY